MRELVAIARDRWERRVIFVDAYLVDWLDLLIRWLHVIAAIVWIGTSFYFVALDSHLRPPRKPRDADEGVGGESWEIHGGGFYRIQKFRVAPETLPEPLHWFKWEAYTTWLSGFALLVVLYYLNADTLPGRPVGARPRARARRSRSASRCSPSRGSSTTGSAGCSATASSCSRRARRVRRASACTVSELFSARAMPIQVGAMLGTMMVGNVLFVIIPGHWELVRAKGAGREPDPVHGIKGKQRSVHNNYLTLPVVLAMLGRTSRPRSRASTAGSSSSR